MTRERRILLGVAIAALVVHAVVIVGVRARYGSVDALAFNSVDSREYYQLAVNLRDHWTFSQDSQPPLQPDTWRTPGYPAVLAAVMLLMGKSPTALVVVQHILCAMNVVLFFALARPHLGERRAVIAALLFLIEPYHLYYANWLMSATLLVTSLLLAWWAWSRAMRSGCEGWSTLAGGLAGAAVLVRPVASLVPVLLLVATAIYCRRGGKTSARAIRMHPRALLMMAVGVSLVVGSWMGRNRLEAGRFALSDQGGVVLAYFKAAEVVLWRDGRGQDRYIETSLDPESDDADHTVFAGIDTRLRERLSHLPGDLVGQLRWRNLAQGNRTPADSFEVSDALASVGWSMLLESPLSTAACCLTRCGSILTFPASLAIAPPAGVPPTRLKWMLISLPYVLLTLAFAIRLLRGGWPRIAVLFPLLTTAALLIATTPQLDPRFRVPLIPMMLFVAMLPVAAADGLDGSAKT